MRKLIFLCLTAATGVLSSCSDVMHVYVPNTVNTPLLKEKNEIKGSVSFSNYQAAYAVTDHFGIMANGQYVNRSLLGMSENEGEDDIIDGDVRGGLFEVGAGYFNAFDRRKRAIFEVYGGYGAGSFKTIDDGYYHNGSVGNKTDYQVSTRFNKIFIQPAIGMSHKVVEASFASRISIIRFHDPRMATFAFEGNPEEAANFMDLNKKWVPFYEPTFTVRVGYKYVKALMQFTGSVPLIAQGYDDNYQYSDYFQPVAFNVGVAFDFGRWLQDK